MSSLRGVTVSPSSATVDIEDNDRTSTAMAHDNNVDIYTLTIER